MPSLLTPLPPEAGVVVPEALASANRVGYSHSELQIRKGSLLAAALSSFLGCRACSPRASLVVPFIALLAATVTGCSSTTTPNSAAAPPATTTTTGAVAATHPAAVRATSTDTTTAKPVTRSTATRTSAPAPTASASSFTAFAGEWSVDAKFISLSRTGRLEEHVGGGCCHPVIDMVIQLSNPHPGRRILVESITGYLFCDPSTDRHGDLRSAPDTAIRRACCPCGRGTTTLCAE